MAHVEPKTEESERMIDLAPEALDVLRSFEKGSTREFVLEGALPNPAATHNYHRCECAWCDLNVWFRGKGVHQQKAFTPFKATPNHGCGAARHQAASLVPAIVEKIVDLISTFMAKYEN